MMEIRKNAGYTITNSLFVGNIELVLGQKEDSSSQFVTWQCTGGDYFWGHYFSDRLCAEKDLYKRAVEKIEDLQIYQMGPPPSQQNKPKNREYER